jgi:hypothetical protein
MNPTISDYDALRIYAHLEIASAALDDAVWAVFDESMNAEPHAALLALAKKLAGQVHDLESHLFNNCDVLGKP